MLPRCESTMVLGVFRRRQRDNRASDNGEPPVYAARARDETALPTKGQVAGVALVTSAVGIALVGPMVGIATGVGVAVLSFTPTRAGLVAREAGDAVAETGNKIKQFNEENQITERTKVQIIEGCEYVAKRLRDCGA